MFFQLCYSNTSILTVHVCVLCMNTLETCHIVQNVGVGGWKYIGKFGNYTIKVVVVCSISSHIVAMLAVVSKLNLHHYLMVIQNKFGPLHTFLLICLHFMS